jgi:Dyp-type peroxidase family
MNAEMMTIVGSAPKEPVLDLLDIQGIVVPGFFKPHHSLVYVRLGNDRQTVERFKKGLSTLVSQVSAARVTLEDRREHRRAAVEGRERGATKVLVAIALSYSGLSRLTPGAAAISSPAFHAGMVQRSPFLGDPVDPVSLGHPSKWTVGAAGAELDAMIVCAGDDRVRVTAAADAVGRQLLATGATVSIEEGDVRADAKGHEHFGFDDGVSQPGIRGRASTGPTDYITERHVDPAEVPAAWLYGYPGQDLVWPGEFVIGYPETGPDPLIPGPIRVLDPPWTRNGSFLVFRRLVQDVALFWQTMQSEAARLSELPGFSGLTKERLAALIVGRWPSGAPLSRSPARDDKALGMDSLANNYFLFDSDTPPLTLAGGYRDRHPRAKADSLGLVCPWAAHIKKVNLRDSASDMGGRNATYARRLLRVGIPFGPSLLPPYSNQPQTPDGQSRGLLFLSIQSSIEDQFEFLQARWINDASRPKMPGGNDMLVGQNTATPDGVRRCHLFGEGLAQTSVQATKQWVIPTGGGYFFVPSISALRNVIAGGDGVARAQHVNVRRAARKAAAKPESTPRSRKKDRKR